MADEEVTPSFAAVISKHLLVNYDRRAWWCQCGDDCLTVEGSHATHVAAALLASFVVVPKDQLHQEWRVTEDGEQVAWPPSLKHAQHIRDHPIGGVEPVIESRWVGLWRPADSKEKP